MQSLDDVLPDMKKNATDLARLMAGHVRRRLGMSPLVVSAMACLWGEVPEDLRKKVLKARHVDVRHAVEAHGNPHAQPKDWAPHLE